MNKVIPNVNFNAFFSTLDSKLEAPVKHHLKNVYSCLAICTFVAATGGYVHTSTALLSEGALTLLLGVGAFITLLVVPDHRYNRPIRLGLLIAFVFFSGINLGPLLNMAIEINPVLIIKALLSSTVMFVCFTFGAIFAKKRKFLYIGGTLMSLLGYIIFFSLVNLLFDSVFLFELKLYLSLILSLCFVLYDTHLIIEKRLLGDEDFIWHCVELFGDLIAIFRILLRSFMIKEKKKNNQNN